VYPLGFCGAAVRDGDRSAAPRLRRLLGWLDYATHLGANGLLLGPIFTSQSHGYDSTNQFAIDPRLGDDSDFDALVAACKNRGLRIVLDGVFSHVGDQHPWLLDALQQGPDSQYGDIFDIEWEAEGGPRPRVWEGQYSLARLNHASATAARYVTDVMGHWLARGIDGWRLDAAYSVPTDFWARVIPDVRQRFPQSWFLGEVIHGDYPGFVAASTVDTVTQYELWKGIWSSLSTANLWELDWALKRHNEFLDSFTPQTFIGNHDVTRIASAVGPHQAITALAVLMTVGGIPSIYYGDEQGATGEKTEQLGGDDSVRPPYPDSPDGLLAFGWPSYRLHQELISLRRRHPWLTGAVTQPLHLDNTHYSYRVTPRSASRTIDGNDDGAASDALTVTINLETDDPTPTVTIRDGRGDAIWEQQRA
jgi:glycosidase